MLNLMLILIPVEQKLNNFIQLQTMKILHAHQEIEQTIYNLTNHQLKPKLHKTT
jgi:hypothetical protein